MSGRWPPPGCGACCTFRYPAPAALPAFSAWGTAPAVRSSRRSCPCWSRWPWWPGWYRPPTSWTARLAGPAQVTLRVVNDGTTVVLEVIDDGQGFVPNTGFPGRLGLRSMHERAEAAGGRLEIVSGPGNGTVVRAVLPARA